MRTRALVGGFLVFCLWAGSLTAQTPAATPARTHSLSLYATVGASGGGTKNAANLNYNPGGAAIGNRVTAEERHFTQQRESEDPINLAVEIRNLSKNPDAVKLDWFFYGRSIKGGEPYLFDGGTQEVSVPPTGTSKVDLQSKALVSRVEKKLYVTDGVNSAGFNPSSASVNKSGEKAVGWAVRMSDGPRVLAIRASSPSFETLGRTAALPTPPPPKRR